MLDGSHRPAADSFVSRSEADARVPRGGNHSGTMRSGALLVSFSSAILSRDVS